MPKSERIFPYPILLNENENSWYNENINFDVHFEIEEENKYLIFKNINFNVNDKSILNLINTNKAKSVILVESSSSIYRKEFEISTIPQDIRIKKTLLKDNVFVTAYIFVTEDINEFYSENISEDYGNQKFTFKKFDTIALNNGVTFTVDYDNSRDNKLTSIFTIIKKEDNGDKLSYVDADDKILINLSPQYYQIYSSLKYNEKYNNIFFSMLIIPALTSCLKELHNQIDDFDIYIYNKRWFRMVCKAYQKKYNNELTKELFINYDPLELSQNLLNYAICKGLEDFKNIINGENEDDEIE